MKPKQAVLFDLDGTLFDTAPDLIAAINQVRTDNTLPILSLEELRPLVSLGSKALLKVALNMDETHPLYKKTREQFLDYYQKNLKVHTQFFPEVEMVLNYLDTHHIPWGIVTNKLTRHTTALLEAFAFTTRPACVVCGDSLPKAKPDPITILHACTLLNCIPEESIYVGDSEGDVIASKAAGTQSLVALYGYISKKEDPYAWQADGYIKSPSQLIEWLKENHG